jgi:hypothetical protein
MGSFCNFQQIAQSEQSPDGRKCPQSGHPVTQYVCQREIERRNGAAQS